MCSSLALGLWTPQCGVQHKLPLSKAHMHRHCLPHGYYVSTCMEDSRLVRYQDMQLMKKGGNNGVSFVLPSHAFENLFLGLLQRGKTCFSWERSSMLERSIASPPSPFLIDDIISRTGLNDPYFSGQDTQPYGPGARTTQVSGSFLSS